MEQTYLTVSILTNYIKGLLVNNPYLENVYLMGEISNLKQSGNNYYLCLKDDKASIKAIIFRYDYTKINFIPKNGDQVYVKGSISLYDKTGEYQIIIKEMKNIGLGDFYQRFIELKDRLQKKGYFDKSHKKPIPEFPKNIALVTSDKGAVIHDLQTIIQRRTNLSNLYLYPTQVQGEDAKYDIVNKIKKAESNPIIDVIIIARGGGSIEDLWPFNEEIVADAIYECKKPIISAIGHESDSSISDFVADLSAATPSDAALQVVKDNEDLINTLNSLSTRLYNSYKNLILQNKTSLAKLLDNKVLINPKNITYDKRNSLDNIVKRIDLLSPKNRLNNFKVNLDKVVDVCNKNYKYLLESKKQYLKYISNKVVLLNPLIILNKGYSVTYKDETIVKESNEVNIDDIIVTKLSKGKITSIITKVEE